MGQIEVSVLFRIMLTFLISKHIVFREFDSLKHSRDHHTDQLHWEILCSYVTKFDKQQVLSTLNAPQRYMLTKGLEINPMEIQRHDISVKLLWLWWSRSCQDLCFKLKVMLLHSYYGLNVYVPSNSYVEILKPNVMVLRGETFGRYLGQEGGALMNGFSFLIREVPECLTPFVM